MRTHSPASSVIHETLEPGHEYTVISLHPVWGWAVMYAEKSVENRTVPTTQRGRVLIHASAQRMSIREEQELRSELSFLSGIPKVTLPHVFPRSVILGSVEIIDSVENAPTKWAAQGAHHWVLREPRLLATPLTVVKIREQPQFWQWTFQTDTSAGSEASETDCPANETGGRRRRSSGVVAAAKIELDTPSKRRGEGGSR